MAVSNTTIHVLTADEVLAKARAGETPSAYPTTCRHLRQHGSRDLTIDSLLETRKTLKHRCAQTCVHPYVLREPEGNHV